MKEKKIENSCACRIKKTTMDKVVEIKNTTRWSKTTVLDVAINELYEKLVKKGQ